jgi:hypothetical protein
MCRGRYDKGMRLTLASIAFACVAFASGGARLSEVHTVYLLHMGNSLDQYLANRLTATGLLQVVTDPQKADAIFTDSIGQEFESRMDELYPPPKKAVKKEEDSQDSFANSDQHFGSWSTGQGTVFLVDRHTRNVIWSTYCPVKGSRADDTEKRANDITKRLQSALKPKKQ